MIKYCDKRFKLFIRGHERERPLWSIMGFPFSICCQIARTICNFAFIPPGFLGEVEHRKSRILNRIIQHEYSPRLLSMKAFDLASDIL